MPCRKKKEMCKETAKVSSKWLSGHDQESVELGKMITTGMFLAESVLVTREKVKWMVIACFQGCEGF